MKKKRLLLGLFALVLSLSVFGNNYRVDDKQLDAIFNNGTEISLIDFNFMTPGTSSPTFITNERVNNDALISWIICWVVGEFGVHRHYLGTKPTMWAIYTFTVCGIFGIVPFVDWWVLLIDGIINDNISPYQNNEKFFMWLK
jgi:TM2 domain-containing membrane protein YozV